VAFDPSDERDTWQQDRATDGGISQNDDPDWELIREEDERTARSAEHRDQNNPQNHSRPLGRTNNQCHNARWSCRLGISGRSVEMRTAISGQVVHASFGNWRNLADNSLQNMRNVADQAIKAVAALSVTSLSVTFNRGELCRPAALPAPNAPHRGGRKQRQATDRRIGQENNPDRHRHRSHHRNRNNPYRCRQQKQSRNHCEQSPPQNSPLRCARDTARLWLGLGESESAHDPQITYSGGVGAGKSCVPYLRFSSQSREQAPEGPRPEIACRLPRTTGEIRLVWCIWFSSRDGAMWASPPRVAGPKTGKAEANCPFCDPQILQAMPFFCHAAAARWPDDNLRGH
jgi:hypothetical protein